MSRLEYPAALSEHHAVVGTRITSSCEQTATTQDIGAALPCLVCYPVVQAGYAELHCVNGRED